VDEKKRSGDAEKAKKAEKTKRHRNSRFFSNYVAPVLWTAALLYGLCVCIGGIFGLGGFLLLFGTFAPASELTVIFAVCVLILALCVPAIIWQLYKLLQEVHRRRQAFSERQRIEKLKVNQRG
jgi:membrane protein implicated in regulation of membrane protease activity